MHFTVYSVHFTVYFVCACIYAFYFVLALCMALWILLCTFPMHASMHFIVCLPYAVELCRTQRLYRKNRSSQCFRESCLSVTFWLACVAREGFQQAATTLIGAQNAAVLTLRRALLMLLAGRRETVPLSDTRCLEIPAATLVSGGQPERDSSACPV